MSLTLTQNNTILGGAALGYAGAALWMGKSMLKPNRSIVIVALLGAATGYLYFKYEGSVAQG